MKTTAVKDLKKWTVQFPPAETAKQTIRRKSFSPKLQQYLHRQSLGENHFKWVGITMLAQAVLITPAVGLSIILTGNNPVFWFFATATMYLTFIPSFSGASTLSIIKTFFTSIVLNISIILTTLIIYFLT
jgi:hypothetical protein